MRESDHRFSRWPLLVFGAVVLLLGLILAIGGIYLATLGGSWYYLLAGVGLVIAGVQLVRGHMSGAWWFAAVFVGTLAWTIWEAGLDYWRWIPRFGLIVVLAFVLALLLPRLRGGPSRLVSWSLAGAFALVFAAFFALAFLPHGYTRTATAAASIDASPAVAASSGGGSLQSAIRPADGDWPAYGRSNAAQRYSPLTQIQRDNVDDLERAWVYRTGDLPDERWGAETTPIEVGGTLYLCSARNILIALDARTGKALWRFDPMVPNENIPYTAACRGVAYYQADATIAAKDPATAGDVGDNADNLVVAEIDASSVANDAVDAVPNQPAPGATSTTCVTRIIEGTLDARLIAVDARSGELCPGFGNHGMVDITEGMGRVAPGMVSITAAPTIVRGVIVTGHQVLDGQRRWAPSGVVQGFDAVTGERLWAWDMMRPGRTTLGKGETFTRGTPNMWTTAAADESLGLVYLPMGNSAADYWSGKRRPLENEYSTSLVALDVTTGKPVWHFQTVHKDVWDFDLGSQPTLVDFPGTGGPVPAIILSSKQGDIYVLDRRTGKPLVGVVELPVPQGGVEPRERTPTQPFSRYHTLMQPPLTERDMWGLSPIDQMICRIQFSGAAYEGIYTPPTVDTHYIQYTGYNGGSDWGSIAVDPRRGVIVANYNDMPNYNRLVPRALANKYGWFPRPQMSEQQKQKARAGGDPQTDTPYAIHVNAGWRLPVTGLLCKQPPYGGIRAIDLASGDTLWDRPLGTARANGPFGIPSGLPIVIGTPNNGGSVITAGGLIFIAAATDNLIRAIDLETGETVWQDVLPAGGQANPMVYEAGGRQYLVIMAGGHHFMETPVGDYVIAYALPNKPGTR